MAGELAVLVAIGPLLTVSLLNEAQNQLHRMHHELIDRIQPDQQTPWNIRSAKLASRLTSQILYVVKPGGSVSKNPPPVRILNHMKLVTNFTAIFKINFNIISLLSAPGYYNSVFFPRQNISLYTCVIFSACTQQL